MDAQELNKILENNRKEVENWPEWLKKSVMKKYVLGFLFSNSIVWLIRKEKPEWQKGRLNGIGGKIEDGELPLSAMEREFKEEAGLEINNWKWFCTLSDDKSYEVYCYYTFSDLDPKTMTKEEVVWYNISCLPSDVIPNLNWLIPMALSFEKGETSKGFRAVEQS